MNAFRHDKDRGLSLYVLWFSWLDGELIYHGRDGEYLNHFACFDAYQNGDVSVADRPLMAKSSSRIHHARTVIQAVCGSDCLDNFTASVKTFMRVDADGVATRAVLEAAQLTHPYETDGLIFTPTGAEIHNASVFL